MSRKKSKFQNSNKKTPYKGPFQRNPNELVQTVKTVMRPEADGPTIDTFSDIDSTTDIKPNDDLDIRTTSSNPQKRRPTKEKNTKKVFSTETIVMFIVGFIATGIGIIVYTHSNKFVAVEKDIDYIQKEVTEQKSTIKEIDNKVINIDKNFELLNQKIELKKEK